MVSFRRCILALAVLALFTGLASAQVNVGGSYQGNLTCTANAFNPTQVRAEGYAELLGDIVIQCLGGSTNSLTPGSPVPLANITVALNNTLVTSRILSSGSNISEALLLIDEPGSSQQFPTPATVLPQTPCAPNPQFGAGPGGCTVQVGTITNGLGTVTEAVLTSSTTTVPNVFQGIVSGNQVIFNGVPILAPVTAGLARVFRITNVRGNANQFAGQAGTFQGQIPILASVSITSGFQVANSVLTIGNLFNGLGATSVRNAANSDTGTSIKLAQCGTAGITPGAVLRFPEGFAAAFKTRITPTATLSGAATSAGGILTGTSFTQNIPGQFSPGSESGFILPTTGGTAGLADFGTRLKATFNNIPSNVNIYVSTTNINPLGNTGVPASTNTVGFNGTANNIPLGPQSTLLAALVLSETATSGTGGFVPLQSNSNNSGGALLFKLTPDANGLATATWEILTANPTAAETAEFAVFYSFAGNPPTTPQITPSGTVALSFAPTFTSPTASTLIPRFAPASTSTTLVSVTRCQTTLLFPFVNAAPGFDTGIAIANTSADPFGTKTQSGACTLNFFGSNAGTTTTATFPTTGVIAPGTLFADQVSNIRTGFTGYVIAVCDFQLAHGYALFSDTGIRNWATGYLALVLPTGSGDRNAADILVGPGTPGSVEGAGH